MSQAVTKKKPHPLKGKGGVVALGVVVVLGIWLAFDLKRPVRDPDANPFVSDYVHVLPPDVTRIEMKRPSSPFTLVKQDGRWRFEQPGNFRADAEQVNTWLKGMLEGIVAQTVDAKQPDLKQYGLDKPAAEVVLSAGGSTRTIQLGKDFRPAGDQGTGGIFFAREQGDGRLFMLTAAQVIALRDKTVDELRDRKLIDVPNTKDVRKLTLIRPSGTLEAQRASSDTWEMTQPFRAPTDKTNTETLIDQLRLGTSVSFVEDDAKDLAKYGLDKPRLVAQLTDGRGTHGVRFGKAAKDHKVYAAREGENQVVTVEETSYGGFDKTAADLRDLRLMTLDIDKVNTLEIRNPHGSSRLQRVGKLDWELVDPNGKKPQKANTETVERILSSLRASAYRHVEEAPKDLAKYGLDKPRITVTLSDGAGSSQIVTLGKTNPEGDYYTKGVPDAVFTVKSYTYADLNVLPAALLATAPDAAK
jgi:hypothetical protein